MKTMILALSLAFAPAAFAGEKGPPHKAAQEHKHKHGKNCGHKAEKHGDHTDYEHEENGEVHHHKKHAGHFDECEGPEAETQAKTN